MTTRTEPYPFALGDIVVASKDVNKRLLVVDIDPPEVCTPYPNVMVSWREGNKIKEAVIQCKYLQIVQKARQ
jgi:hypothetical protein